MSSSAVAELLILREPQHPMVEWMAEHDRCALFAGMGIGKSSAALFAMMLTEMMGETSGDPWLVIGPPRVARQWPDEAAKWTQFRHLDITALNGPEDRPASPTERLLLLKNRSQIFTVSYELLPWLVEHYMGKWPFRQVVADEADYLKGFREKSHGTSLSSKKSGHSGKRAFQIGRVAHTLVKRWVNLAGTPAPNGLVDLWGSMWFVDKGQRLGRTYTAFMQRWFRPKWSGYGVEPLPYAQDQIHAAIHDVCLTVDPADYFDLRKPIVNPIKVKLPPHARKLYQKLEKDLFAELLCGAEIDVLNQGSLANKCLQLANGALYTDYPEWAEVHSAKIEALESVLHEAGGMPLLVQCSFKSDFQRIKRAFPKAVELATPNGMRAFRAGDSPIGMAHPKSMGHGIDGLQLVTNQLVRFGHIWAPGLTTQIFERIGPMRQFQAGLERPTFEHQIIAEDTTDEDVIGSHIAKCSVQEALRDAMKRRG